MGVDYSGNYGVGVQVSFENLKERIIKECECEEEEVHWYYSEFIDFVLKDTSLLYFEVGEGAYTGEQNKFYIVMDDPFKGGYDITEEVIEFEKKLKDIGFVLIGETDVVGGLEIH